MRKIVIASYITMDGVLQAPGGPEEDRSNGFKWGGWSAPYWDELMYDAVGKIMSSPFDLLLGRRTYEIFAAHWPYQNDAIGEIFNRIHKYVVATTPIDLSWKESILINKDVVNELKKIKKQDGPDLLVFGSSRLIQTLLSNQLVDVLHTWIFPITLGEGKKLFDQGTQAQQWKLTGSLVSTTGAIIASYVPDGEVKLGSFVPENPSDAELARREKWSRE
jgi:dihydrofolate reductase